MAENNDPLGLLSNDNIATQPSASTSKDSDPLGLLGEAITAPAEEKVTQFEAPGLQLSETSRDIMQEKPKVIDASSKNKILDFLNALPDDVETQIKISRKNKEEAPSEVVDLKKIKEPKLATTKQATKDVNKLIEEQRLKSLEDDIVSGKENILSQEPIPSELEGQRNEYVKAQKLLEFKEEEKRKEEELNKKRESLQSAKSYIKYYPKDILFADENDIEKEVNDINRLYGISKDEALGLIDEAKRGAMMRKAEKSEYEMLNDIEDQFKNKRLPYTEKDLYNKFDQDAITEAYSSMDENSKKAYPKAVELNELIEQDKKTPSATNKAKIIQLKTEIADLTKNKKMYFDPVTGQSIDQPTPEAVQYQSDVNNEAENLAKVSTKDQLKDIFRKRYAAYKYAEQLYSDGNKYLTFPMMGNIAGAEDPTNISVRQARTIKDNYIKAKRDFDAISQAYLLNRDPSGVERSALKLGLEAAANELIPSSLFPTGVLNNTNKKYIESIKNLANDYGLKLTDAQKERFENTFVENVAEGIGGLGGMLPKLWLGGEIIGAGEALVGLDKAIALLSKGDRIERGLAILGRAVTEEAKMTTIGMPLGVGTGFILAGGIKVPKLSGKYGAILQPFFNKIVQSSIGGTAGQEVGEITKSAVEALNSNTDFKEKIDELFPNVSEVTKRIAQELIVNGVIGIAHLKKTDFKTSPAELLKASNELYSKGYVQEAQELKKKADQIRGYEVKSNADIEREAAKSRITLTGKSLEEAGVKPAAEGAMVSRENISPEQIDAIAEKITNKVELTPQESIINSIVPTEVDAAVKKMGGEVLGEAKEMVKPEPPKDVVQEEIDGLARKIKSGAELTEREAQIKASLPEQVNSALVRIGEKPMQVVAPEVKVEISEPLKDVKSTAKALEQVNTAPLEASLLSEIAGGRIVGKSAKEVISEAYHADKAAGRETELTKAVEELLKPKEYETETTRQAEKQPMLEGVSDVGDKAKAGEAGAELRAEEKRPVAEVKTEPAEGDMVELEPQIKGGIPRRMVFKDGEWLQQVGNETTVVGNTVKKQAQAEWMRQNEAKAAEAPVAEVKAAEVVTETPESKARKAKLAEILGPKPEKVAEEATEPAEAVDIKSPIRQVEKSLKKSGINYIIAENKEDYNNITNGVSGRESQGIFLSDEGVIIINKEALEKGWETVVIWHEGVHPVINIIRNTNPKLYDSIIRGLQEAREKGVKGIDDVFNWADNNYRGEEKLNDEKITETIARIADGKISLPELPKSLRQDLIDFINKIAKALGIQELISVSDEVAFKRTAEKIAKALREGRDISEVVGEKNVKRYEANLGEQLSKWGAFEKLGFEETEDFNKLIKSGHIVQDYKLSEMSGSPVFIINPDNMLVGTVKIGDKIIAKGEGGVHFVSNTGDIWAFSDTSRGRINAKMMSDFVNEQLQKNGVANIVLSKGDLGKLFSSHAGAKGAMRVLESLVDKKIIKTIDFRNALKEVSLMKDIDGAKEEIASLKKQKENAVNKNKPFSIEKQTRLNNLEKNIEKYANNKYDINFTGIKLEDIHKDVEEQFFNKKDNSFSNRGTFVADVIEHLAQNADISKEKVEKLREFLNTKELPKSSNKKTGRITFTSPSIKDAVGLLFSDEATIGAKNSDAYAVIRVENPEFPIEMTKGAHESYGAHVRQVVDNIPLKDFLDKYKNLKKDDLLINNKNEVIGIRPKLLLLSEKYHIADVINDFNNKPTGATQLGSNTVGIAKGIVKADLSEISKKEIATPIEEMAQASRGLRGEPAEMPMTEQEKRVSVYVAPFFDTMVRSVEDAKRLQNSPAYKKYLDTVQNTAKDLGLEVETVQPNIGKYINRYGDEVIELSNKIELKNATLDQATDFAAMLGTLTPEVQESTIAAQHIGESLLGSKRHTANKHTLTIDPSKLDQVRKLADESGLESSLNLETNSIDFLEFSADWFDKVDFNNKLRTFVNKLNENGIKYESRTIPVESRFIEAKDTGEEGQFSRERILADLGKQVGLQPGREILRDAISEAQRRNQEFIRQEEVRDERKRYGDLRQKQIELQNKGESLSADEVKEMTELYDKLLPVTEETFTNAQSDYNKAKAEIEKTAENISKGVGFLSTFGIKKAARAAVKTLRWYRGKAQWLGDGARTNIIVFDKANIEPILKKIQREYDGGIIRQELADTDLGYPKKLIEVRTSNGKIAEFQVMTPEGYLAKDGVKEFNPEKQEFAKQALRDVQDKLGWNIPDGVGHYFYEINRDLNVPKELRDQAKEISLKYYDAFLNPESRLTDREFRDAVADFKAKVDAADKSAWDKGNEGKSPETLNQYLKSPELQFSRGERSFETKEITLADGRKVETKSLPDELEVINGFYSPLQKTILESKQDKMPAKQWIEKFARGEEAKWTGLQDWLSQQKGSVSKEEIVKYLKDNRISVSEVVKGKGGNVRDNTYNNIQEELSRKGIEDENKIIDNWYYENGSWSDVEKFLDDNNIDIDYVVEKSQELQDETKFFRYQLEGEKENYKEVLVTLPNDNKQKQIEKLESFRQELKNKYGDGFKGSQLTDEEVDRLQELKQKAQLSKDKFKSSHFDEPNILVHLRMNTRTDADGNKVLFLEEVQSDWGQTGKREGFKKPFVDKELKDWLNSNREENDVFDKLIDKYSIDTNSDEGLESQLEQKLLEQEKGIPTAPFVMDTNAWTKLGLKVALKEAVAQGADKIAWTTGEQQNARYDLSKSVDEIRSYKYIDGGYGITGNKNGDRVFEQTDIPEDKLSDYVGKDLAEKIIKSYEPYEDGVKVFSGGDLRVGGKGMKGFYGSMEEGTKGIVGGVAEKVFGQKVGETKISENVQPSVDITPELRAEVQKGLPQFSKGERADQKVVEWISNSMKEGATEKEIIDSLKEYDYSEEQINQLIEQSKSKEYAVQERETTEMGAYPVGDEGARGKEKGEGVGQGKQGPEVTRAGEEVPKGEEEQLLGEQEKGFKLNYAGTDLLRQELGLGKREVRESIPLEQTEAEAIKRIKEGIDVNKLADDIINNNRSATTVEHIILTKRIAILDAELAKLDPLSKDFNDKLREIDHLSKASETAGSLAGSQLGIRSKYETLPDDSIASFFIKELDINNGADLTDAQKTQVRKEFDELSAAKKALEEKVAKLMDENAKLKSKKALETAISNRRKNVSKEKLDQEFEDLSSKFASLLKGERATTKAQESRGQFSRADIDDASSLIKKMFANRVDSGMTSLNEIIDSIHGKVGEFGISKEQINDAIAGKYNVAKETRSEAAKRRYDLITEARLISKYEQLKQGVEPKTEKKRIERNQKLNEIRMKIKEHDLTKLAAYKRRIESEIAKLDAKLKSNDPYAFAKPSEKRPIELDEEAKKLRYEYLKKKSEREVRMLKFEYERRSSWEKGRDKFLEVANVPRTIMSSMDFSAPLRQGLWAGIAHPTYAAKAGLEMFRQSVSQKRFDQWFADVKDDPRYQMSQEAGLYIADPHDPRLSVKEEAFMNNLAEKIPVAGKLIKGSERAYVGYLNKLRWDLFMKFAEQYEKAGKTIENSPELYKGLADYINNSTGRGKLGPLETAAPVLNTVIFSPRLVASRVNLLTKWADPRFYYKVPKEVRVEYFKDVAKFLGVGMTVLALAKLNGATVEDDPRSTDFGKIVVGKTRYDIWGGFQPYVRLIAQIITGEKKTTTTKEIKKLDGQGAFGESRADVIGRFARGKLAPIPSMVVDYLSGRTVSGEEVTLSKEAESRLLPLIYSDVKEAYKDKGVSAIFTVGVPAAFGVGVQTYSEKEMAGKGKKPKVSKRPMR